MDGMKMWNEGPLVDGACPNENCAEHMIAVRYPATMEYINHLGVVYSYFDLPMRCSTCGSLYPPANESQMERQPAVERMREKSGTVKTDDKLVMFLYLLARDWVPTGTIDELVNYKVPVSGTFTNGWLAQWAQDVAKRLTATDEKNDPRMGMISGWPDGMRLKEGALRPPDPDG